MVFSARHALNNGIEAASRYFRYLGYIAMSVIALVVTVDVLGRSIFNRPIRGGPEIVELVMVLAIFFMLPHVTGAGEHITMDAFVSLIPQRVRRVTSVVFDIVILSMLALLTWQAFAGAFFAKNFNSITATLSIPHYPFRFVLAAGFALAFLTFLLRLARNLTGSSRK